MQTRNRYLTAAGASVAAVAAAAGLLLLGPLHAQAKGTSNQGNMGMMGMTMGAMDMSGTATMGDKPYDVRCTMTPIGKPKMMKGMAGMAMDTPMKMSGTMTMMGQKYRCDMEMTPKTK